jgi:hypothetical protein
VSNQDSFSFQDEFVERKVKVPTSPKDDFSGRKIENVNLAIIVDHRAEGGPPVGKLYLGVVVQSLKILSLNHKDDVGCPKFYEIRKHLR